MKKIGIGIIGVGDISDVYIKHLLSYDTVKIIACGSRSLDKALEKAKAYGIEKAYGSSKEVIDDPEVDLILNLTTPRAHYEINKMALEAGKHVYTEKPMAIEFDQALELVEIANVKGVRIGSAPDTFFGSRFQTYKHLIDSGSIGDIIGAGAYVVHHGLEWFHPNPDFFYDYGAGPMLDIGPYYIVALIGLLGPVKRVSAMSNRAFNERQIENGPRKGEKVPVIVDTNIVANIEFVSGTICSMVASFDVWDSNLPRLEIYGTKATLSMDEVNPYSGPNLFGGDTLYRDVDNYRWKEPSPQGELSPWKIIDEGRPYNSVSHRKNARGIGLIDMIQGIEEGRPYRASGEMALHGIEVLQGILKSATDGVFVEMTTSFKIPGPLDM